MNQRNIRFIREDYLFPWSGQPYRDSPKQQGGGVPWFSGFLTAYPRLWRQREQSNTEYRGQCFLWSSSRRNRQDTL